MLIGIYTNKSRDAGLVVTKKFIELLKSEKLEFCVSKLITEDVGCAHCYDDGQLAENADILVVFGGDGTVLSVIADAAKSGKPVLAINTGNLGFLTGAERHELTEAVKALKTGKYSLDRRSMLKADINNNTYYALNEIVLIRESYTSVIKIDAYNNGKYMESYTADGVMVATPTGSTAYALSAGGPVLSPHVNAFELIAISPHSLMGRPIVFPDTDIITFKIAADMACVLVHDGMDIPYRLYGKDTVTVSRAPFDAVFIHITPDAPPNFYERLMTKMNGKIK